jgi:hypothetical protein
MARENQGLQIALIVSVMLTIILTVTAFLLYRNYDEACIREKAANTKATDADKQAKTAVEENNRLKQLIGVPVTETMQKVDELFKKDMETYATGLQEEKRVYREVLRELSSTLRDRGEEVKVVKDNLKKLTDEYEAHKASKNAEVQKFEAAANSASKDLADERGKFKADVDRLRADHASAADMLEKVKKEGADKETNLSGQVTQLGQSMGDMTKKYKDTRKQLDDVLKETIEVPAGLVSQVNQRGNERERTVYINLGRADRLRRQVNFSVYAADATDLTKAGRKAGIEVTEILGDHLAEAKILDDQPGDPIIRGDKIYTPVWTPGEQRHFAVAGMIDMDNNGVDDQASLCGLIRLNGGIVDCEMNEKGEIHGQMSVQTRYLILGDTTKITEKSTKSVIDANTKMAKEAERLGVPQKPLAKFLEELGWKNHTPMVQYGLGANPNDFRAKAPAGGNKVSSGNVSDLFKPRTPPKVQSNGAY